MPYKKRLSAQQTADRERSARRGVEVRREKGEDCAEQEMNRLQTLRNDPKYKIWLAGWQAQHASMDTVGFRGLDRSKGRSSDG